MRINRLSRAYTPNCQWHCPMGHSWDTHPQKEPETSETRPHKNSLTSCFICRYASLTFFKIQFLGPHNPLVAGSSPARNHRFLSLRRAKASLPLYPASPSWAHQHSHTIKPSFAGYIVSAHTSGTLSSEPAHTN